MTATPTGAMPLDQGSDWTFPLLESYEREISRIAADFRLDTYPNQIEVISSEQMMDAYASSGMPINYHHWSFGKRFIQVENQYRRGFLGLAYEIVINSNPCISYLMEENTSTLQALVIAHACYGHNSFFKNNYLFRTWTDASSIIDYLVFARKFIRDCEERHGIDTVERVLDACHALLDHGVDRYKRPYPISMEEEERRQIEREEHLQRQINDLWRTIPTSGEDDSEPDQEARFPAEPQENLLYFIEKNAPLMESWQREIVRIVRKFSQYLYPQRQTKVMNEGWATFWHFTILQQMYLEHLVSDGFMIEFLQHHTNVIYQPPYDSPQYSGINPYTLGFAIFQDIRRICEQPTEEDRIWFPDLVNSDWLEAVHFAMENFKDESFILQYLSPKVIRDLKLFAVFDDADDNELVITAIHNSDGYQAIRERLAALYNLGSIQPNIQIHHVNIRGDRALTLRHEMHNDRPLHPDETAEVLKHLRQLWGFDIHLESVKDGKVVSRYHCPPAASTSDR
ncbi:SpoVR family protein [Kineobactrum salinum]|uniref:SpoVR family protein n=1 Tax=Kineobactrum salinum TaxID=2708301 RepID=A0A6C0TYZ3_9GAMM|nr:SpoVR family protein [Kineobactrum salinum]QIB65042.1 SpoVR family protein [Kineobactrum salinum]